MADYPLGAVRVVREGEQQRAVERLAAALRARDEARETRRGATEALRAHRDQPPAPPETGPALGAAVIRQAAVEGRWRREADAYGEALRHALAAERAADRALRDAKGQLTDAAVATEVVARHEARWRAAQRKAAERAEDEELDEMARSRR